MATMTVRHGIQPQVLLAFLVAVAIAFVAGERVGVRLAMARAIAGAASVAPPAEPPLVPYPATPGALAAGTVGESTELPPDCNPNHR